MHAKAGYRIGELISVGAQNHSLAPPRLTLLLSRSLLDTASEKKNRVFFILHISNMSDDALSTEKQDNRTTLGSADGVSSSSDEKSPYGIVQEEEDAVVQDWTPEEERKIM